jgi:hypothetical protein
MIALDVTVVGIEGRRLLTPEHKNERKDVNVREMREGQQ